MVMNNYGEKKYTTQDKIEIQHFKLLFGIYGLNLEFYCKTIFNNVEIVY